VAAIKAVDSDTRAISGCPLWFALPICVIGAAGLLRDAWPTALYLPGTGLHALFGVMLLTMVLAQFRQASRSAPAQSGAGMHELSRRLSRGVFLQLYILFGMSQIVRLAVILWNNGQRASPMAILQPPENLRDYLAYGILALLTIHALATRQQHLSRASLRAS
jgi:cytochrome b561